LRFVMQKRGSFGGQSGGAVQILFKRRCVEESALRGRVCVMCV